MARTRSGTPTSSSASDSAKSPPSRPTTPRKRQQSKAPRAAVLKALKYLPKRTEQFAPDATDAATWEMKSALIDPTFLTQEHTVRFTNNPEKADKSPSLKQAYHNPPVTPGKRSRTEDETDIAKESKRNKPVSPPKTAIRCQHTPLDQIEDELHEAIREFPKLHGKAEELAAEKLAKATALSIDDMSKLLRHLQLEMRKFSLKFFAFHTNREQAAAWPLHQLSTKYAPLFRTAQHIADGSQHNWRRFFTESAYRPHLIYGILGEWFKHHIFNATAFGMSPDELEALENVDRIYMHYDTFVKAKQRCNLLKAQLDTKAKLDEEYDMKIAIDKFANQLLVVLEPLTSTFMLAPEKLAHSLQASQIESANYDLQSRLKQLIHLAAKIQLGIRLAGEDGTIVRFCPAIQKGERFSQCVPQNVINKKACNETSSCDYADELRIKMTCFSRVEAMRPEGPDQLQLEIEYARAAHAAGKSLVKVKYSDDKSDFKGESSIKLRETLWPWLPAELQGTEVDRSGNKANTKVICKRGSYVTITQLCPADVYLEWSPKPENELYGGHQYHLSLQQAIAEARRERHLHLYDRLCTVLRTSRPAAEWTALVLFFGWCCRKVEIPLKSYPMSSKEVLVLLLNTVKEKFHLPKMPAMSNVTDKFDVILSFLNDTSSKFYQSLKAYVDFAKEIAFNLPTPGIAQLQAAREY